MPKREILYLTYVKNLTVVHLHTLQKPFLYAPTKSFITWCMLLSPSIVCLIIKASNKCFQNDPVTMSREIVYIVKPLNSGHLRVLKNLSVIERCSLLGRNLTKIVTFGTKRFVRYSVHVLYLGCPLLGGFTVFLNQVLEVLK